MTVRFAAERDLPAVNLLRRELHALHAKGRPETFKPGFPAELENYLRRIWEDPLKSVVVAEEDGVLCGFAILNEITRPETPYMFERHYLDVDELGVAASHRRQGVGTALIGFIKACAAQRGFDRVELNMWEFNQSALTFYEALGFTGYRRYMELML